MNATRLFSYTDLLENLKTCTRLQFNGKLVIESDQGQQWDLYYRLGRIVCAIGGEHPVRRWHRQMKKYSPLVETYKSEFRESDLVQPQWDYQILRILRQRQEVNMEQIAAIVEGTISEIVFDIAQQTFTTALRAYRDDSSIIESPLTLSRRGYFIKQLEKKWLLWEQSGLSKISPNLAPVLRNAHQLQEQVNPTIYKNFTVLLNGKLTLRDLAVNMKQDKHRLTRSLLPYLQKGLVELVTIADFPKPKAYDSTPLIQESQAKLNSPLIAFVDDSPQACYLLEKIVVGAGYRCLALSEPLTALPKIIQQKPNLIFLDLVMPVANGYELCSQLRRIPVFARTPIIILTGNDGFFDRVRAKLVGTSDYLTKPIEAEKVLKIIGKYLPADPGLKQQVLGIQSSSASSLP